jgi:vancomycin permeability regulator SanA
MSATLKRTLRWTAIGVAALFLSGAVAIAALGLRDRVTGSDLAVVPGNTVNPDGTPSLRLRGRLDAALELYDAGRCRAVLVSGGIGSEGFDEAEAMKAYLSAKGVPAAAIYTDNHGVNTFETARFTAALLRAKGFDNPILVSQYFHIARFRLAMRKHGVRTGGNVHSRRFEPRDVYSLGREVVAYVAYAFKQDCGDGCQGRPAAARSRSSAALAQ